MAHVHPVNRKILMLFNLNLLILWEFPFTFVLQYRLPFNISRSSQNDLKDADWVCFYFGRFYSVNVSYTYCKMYEYDVICHTYRFQT